MHIGPGHNKKLPFFNPNIRQKVIKVFYKKGKLVLRIVKWNDRPPVLEKRRMLRAAQGENFPGRCVGFNQEDIKLIKENYEEILLLLFDNGDSNGIHPGGSQ